MSAAVISAGTMKLVIDLVNSINHGTITLTVQDSRLLQLERNDKIRLDSGEKTDAAKKPPLTAGQIERLQKRLQGELRNLQFGQVLLHVRGGMISQIERTEKQRYSSLEGIYGDGI
ncbi:MAG: YezD family protein [Sporomusaceae bacterium]|nr:YezD family protein [Sporomusaceae bacterium]